jgi:hypothetical protein
VKKHIIICLTILLFAGFAKAGLPQFAHANPPQKEYYSILVYHLKDAAQETRLDAYLKDALIPAAHKAGVSKIGIFKPIDNDTSADRRIYVFIPGHSAEQLLKLPNQLNTNNPAAKDYVDATWDQPVYTRMETIILEAFPEMLKMEIPVLKSAKSERVYELRSYESASEKLHQNKVDMFNKGGEVKLFKRLGFNAVFYADVLSGSHMPNLMYMTTFENRAAREEHWKTFSSDPEWKALLPQPQYAHNTSHSDIILLHPAEYSDF